MEIWKWVVGYEGRYEISSAGRIKSHLPGKPVRFLKTGLTTAGYPRLVITDGGKSRTLLIHRLLARAFLPNPLGLREVNHKDGNKVNNNLANLEWVSPQQNIQHAWDSGLMRSNPPYGERARKSHLTNDDVLSIRRRYIAGETNFSHLGRQYRVSHCAIRNIIIRKTWSHL